MFSGQVDAVFLAVAKTESMQSQERVQAVAGQGLVGDRYFLGQGSFSQAGRPDREVTLIEAEAIEAVVRDLEFELTAEETRRNLVTRGVPLNHLVGREFLVGEVRLRGMKLCEPCGHLEKLTGKNVLKALRHRGGLRARILSGGEIRVGHPVRPAES